LARTGEAQDGYSDFGGGPSKAWLRVRAPFNTALRDGTGLSDKPSGIVLEAVSDAGVVTTYWMWIDSNGLLHTSTSEPTNQDETTTYSGPKNIRTGTVRLNPNTLGSRSTVMISTIITGVAAGDLIILEPPSFTTGVSLTGWTVELVGRVDNTNEVKFKFINIDDSGAAVTVGNDAYRYFWYDFT